MDAGRHFRTSLGEFATGVGIVTSLASDGRLVGTTISSFNSVSIDPPLVLFSIDRLSSTLGALTEARAYAVNILGTHQDFLSNKFAKPSLANWSDVDHRIGLAGVPLIAGALACFECSPFAAYDGGDHLIFVGRVERHQVNSSHPLPLIFFRGRYRQLDCDGQRLPEAAVWPLPMHY